MGIDSEMFVKVGRQMSDAEIRKLASDCAEAFGPDRFFIRRDRNQHCIERLQEAWIWDSDDPDLEPNAAPTVLEINLWTRYWGEGYERGDLPFLVVLAEWLERRIPDSEIVYGGDSSSCGPESFDKVARAERLDHFARVGNGPYRKSRESFMQGAEPPVCEFCQRRYITYSWGPGPHKIASCHGCSHKIETDDEWVHFVEVKDAKG